MNCVEAMVSTEMEIRVCVSVEVIGDMVSVIVTVGKGIWGTVEVAVSVGKTCDPMGETDDSDPMGETGDSDTMVKLEELGARLGGGKKTMSCEQVRWPLLFMLQPEPDWYARSKWNKERSENVASIRAFMLQWKSLPFHEICCLNRRQREHLINA